MQASSDGIANQLKRRFERVRRVADLGVSALGPDDGADIETRRGLGTTVAGEEELACLGELVALRLVDLFFGGGIVVGAGLDLDEHERLAVAGDDVDLADGAPEVALDDLVTLVAQVLGGHVLAATAEDVFDDGVVLQEVLEPREHAERFTICTRGVQGSRSPTNTARHGRLSDDAARFRCAIRAASLTTRRRPAPAIRFHPASSRPRRRWRHRPS